MGAYTDRIKVHPVWGQLEAIGAATDKAIVRDEITSEGVEGVTRLKTIFSFVGQRLAATDALLINSDLLDQLARSATSAFNELELFIANGNEAHITNANTHADPAITTAASVLLPLTPNELTGLRQAADAYREGMEIHAQALSTALNNQFADVDRFRDRFSELANDVQTEKQRLTSLTTDYQSQFSAAQEARIKEFSDAQTERANKVNDLILSYTQSLTRQEVEWAGKRDMFLEKQRVDLAEATGKFEDEANSTLRDMNMKLEEVEKLTGVIGNLAVTSGYQKTANEAMWTARVWQVVALSSMGGLIYTANKSFLPLIQGEGGVFSWPGFAGRVFVSLTMGLLAGYAMSQAEKYQQVERRSRKLALELEAVGPFLSTLDPAKQQEFRLRLGEKTFGASGDFVFKDRAKNSKSVFGFASSREMRLMISEIIKAVRGRGD